MASSKPLTEEQIQEGLIDKIAQKIVLHIFNNKLSAIEKMGIPDDVKRASKKDNKEFKDLQKSLKKAEKLRSKRHY